MKVAAVELARSVRWADIVELTKPRITLMVVLTTAVGALLAPPEPFPLLLFLHGLLGTGLLAGGAAALNQVLEREGDARMRRTAGRPVASGRLGVHRALQVGLGLSLVGLLELALRVNLLTALLGAFTLGSYVLVYTPLKRITPASTLVGAVPGAIPPLMGWTALHNRLDPAAWVLFGILFFWQVPHFLAIAWIYRSDYARGGFPMLPVRDPQGVRTATHTVLFSAALIGVSLLPWSLGLAGPLYLGAALGLGGLFLLSCVAFGLSRSTAAARRLMIASVVYLPAVLAVAVLDRLA